MLTPSNFQRLKINLEYNLFVTDCHVINHYQLDDCEEDNIMGRRKQRLRIRLHLSNSGLTSISFQGDYSDALKVNFL